jgi:transposase-like protein
VKAVTEELCGHEFSASVIRQMNGKRDEELKKFAERRWEEEYPYRIVDARYEKVREDGVIQSQAVRVAIGITWEGRRQILGVEWANRESRSSGKEFLVGLKARGLRGVERVISDDHEGLKKAIREALPEAAWPRCYVHFLRHALDYLPRKADDDCLLELRWLYDRRSLEEARTDLAAWLKKWPSRYPKLGAWVAENIEETFPFYRWPQAHHNHLKSTNLLERLNQELKRRTHVVRIFPNAASCLRLTRALAVEIHEDWIEQHRYLNMELFKEHKKQKLLEAVA